jgi:TonB-linked SusC/RagA family outer membrane protein
MKKLCAFLACFVFVGVSLLQAQTVQITGTVSSTEEGPLPGVSIIVKGTTVGTTTDGAGNYSINVPANASTLTFSFMGYKTQDVAIAGRKVIEVALEMDALALEEIVVTAMGITREKKSLGYAVQEVKGEDVNLSKGDNFLSQLSGRVAGVNVKSNTNFGGSNNIVIRGSSSLTGNNQALFVVDGIPVDNSQTNNGGQTTGRNGYDYGNAASDINPNDIESITVLKGAAATALYGSRAANGVILIITKKGTDTGSKGPQVKLSSNITFSTMDKSTFPKYQNKYGAGYGKYYYSGFDEDPEDGIPDDGSEYFGFEYYGDVDGDGNVDYTVPYYEDGSRGEKFNPSLMVFQWDALYPESPNYMKATPWIAGANGPDTFFGNGYINSQNIEIAGGNESTTYRLGYTYFDQGGIMPNSYLTKNNVIFTGSQKLFNNKVTVSSSANYIKTSGIGRPSTGYSDNIMSSFRQWYQVNTDIKQQKEMYELTNSNVTWNPVSYDNTAPAYWDNPYWVRYKNYETDGRSRFIGYAQFDWDINSDFKAMGRYAIDGYSELQEERKAIGSGSGEFGVNRPDVTSGYSRFSRDFQESNLDFMLNYRKKIADVIDLSALVGTNIRRTRSESVYASTNNGLAVPNLFSLNNTVDPQDLPEESIREIGVNGIFGSVSLGLLDTYFIDATVRRDQSSSLPAENNAYLYPSITGSILFSNLIKQDWLSLGKVRLNYAEVGSSAPALSVKDTYRAIFPLSGNSLATVPNTKLNPNLKPERQRALEGGLEMNFFKNRVGFDLAFYKNNTVDQLMPVSISYATGFASKWVNAGEIENKGIELQLNGTPIKSSDFSWSINLNWAKNQNKVVELYTDETGNKVTNLEIASLQGGVSINATVGQPYGTIQGTDFLYHDNGGKLINPTNGRYLKSSTNDVVIGDVNPDWNAGIRNSFKYKNIALSFLIDMQQGGDIFSLDLWYGMGTGLYEETAGTNDLGNDMRDPIVWNSADHTQAGGYAPTSGGVIEEGVLADGSANWVRRNQENYNAIGWARDPNARFIYDASYIKLRELAITYTLPKNLVSKISMAGASVSFVGSNLWIIHKNLPYADPEASQGAGNIQGWQSGVMPATRNFGFTLNLQF